MNNFVVCLYKIIIKYVIIFILENSTFPNFYQSTDVIVLYVELLNIYVNYVYDEMFFSFFLDWCRCVVFNYWRIKY